MDRVDELVQSGGMVYFAVEDEKVLATCMTVPLPGDTWEMCKLAAIGQYTGMGAGRANGTTNTLDGNYDGYAECVKVTFDEKATTVAKLMEHLFEIINPYSLNKQGVDVGKKYRTGIYSTSVRHLDEAKAFIEKREDRNKIVVEVLPLTNYVRSAEEHQHHLERYPEDCSLCYIPDEVLNKYRDN